MQTSGAFSSLVDLDPVLTEIFFQNYAQLSPKLLNVVYGVRNSTKSKETHQRIGSFSDPQPWDGQVAYDKAFSDYQIEWQHGTLTKGFVVEKELLEDNQYSGIFDRAQNLGQAFSRKIVKDEAATFNNAFTTVGYDGKALCATDHPRSKQDSTAVSNYLGTKALNEDNLESAINTLEGLGDDLGEETGAMATILLVGRQNRRKALELTRSPYSPETANNAINVNEDIIPIIHPMISGKKWFVIDGEAAKRMLIWYWRIMTYFDTDEDKSSTLSRKYYGRNRYSKGWQDFRFVVGSNPS